MAALAPAGTGSPAPIVGQARVPIRIVGIAPVPSAERIGKALGAWTGVNPVGGGIDGVTMPNAVVGRKPVLE